MEAAEANDGNLVIACANKAEPAKTKLDASKVVEVTCLGRIDESLIVELAAQGAKSVTLVQGDCAGCEHAPGIETAHAVLDTSETLLDTWRSGLKLSLAEKFPASVRRSDAPDHDESKREFFGSVVSETKNAIATGAEYATEKTLGTGADESKDEPPRLAKVSKTDGTLPHRLPKRRKRLMLSLAALGEPADDLINTRLWGNVIMDEDRCNGCKMCAVFCPTGAIEKKETPDGDVVFEHHPARCVKCRSCVNICPERAVELSEEIFARDIASDSYEVFTPKKKHAYEPGPYAIQHSLKNLLGTDQIYER